MLNDVTCFKAVYIVSGYTDLRSGMDRLAALIETQNGNRPYVKAALYLFCGRRADCYLAVLYDCLHEKMYGYHVLQADETSVLVNKDGRSAVSRIYMWVYRAGQMYTDRQIVLYEYQWIYNAGHPRGFLKDFSGICVTNGY